MFSFRGTIIKADEVKQSFILALDTTHFTKVCSEINLMRHAEDISQPLLPHWIHEEKNYCKLLLSKANKKYFEVMRRKAFGKELVYSVRIMPYEYANAKGGLIKGFSLYFASAPWLKDAVLACGVCTEYEAPPHGNYYAKAEEASNL